jgi:hypothetical protein
MIITRYELPRLRIQGRLYLDMIPSVWGCVHHFWLHHGPGLALEDKSRTNIYINSQGRDKIAEYKVICIVPNRLQKYCIVISSVLNFVKPTAAILAKKFNMQRWVDRK